MTIASLMNVPYDDPSFQQFSFANADEHSKIAQKIFDIFGVSISTPVLDPIPTFDMGGWLYTHQEAHNEQNQILGVPGNDLTTFDPQDRSEMANWIFIHAQEHILAARVLKLG